jgi:DNA-binding NarL/FixJ family response regulator
MDSVGVLLVSTSPTFLRFLTLFLQRYDDVVIVGTSSDVERDLQRTPSLRPQVIVTDLDASELTGLEMTCHLRATMPDVGIVAMSLLGSDNYREMVLSDCADAFVPKTKLCAELPPVIRRVAQTKPLATHNQLQTSADTR